MLSLIPLFPLIGFVVNGFWYALGQSSPGAKKAGATVPGTIATLSIFASFVVSLLLFVQLNGLPVDARSLEQNLFSWMTVGTFNIDVALRFDSLSSLFCLVITGVGTLIHMYSVGYMSHDKTPGKFFAYLNLFCFAMLMLVLGSSLPVLFLGWEGVGLCSYLLIGYWYEDDEKASAGKKAFVVNRIGDLGFLLGMFLIFTTFGTLDFDFLKTAIVQGHGAVLPPGVDVGTVTAICVLLFVGCMGKSAQIPLYVWLPDAMAGPTPVSALIHAATMVTSGIYLVSRLNFLFALSPTAMTVVAVIGGLTAFVAATIAVAQKDIKKVLAYSTVSQLGYMFLACGVGAFGAGVFHVITHAFFKALLFLGAGSVIHGMNGEQDISKMGGLRKLMPRTYWTFAAGWLAICGVPFFSGFFSKDEVLWFAFGAEHGSPWLWGLAALTAVMTAFYMTRLFYLTFFGEPRFKQPHGHGHGDDHGHGGVHESPWAMTVPLMILAVLSAIGGFIGVPHMSWLGHWLDPVVPHHVELAEGVRPWMEFALMAFSTVAALIGIVFAWNTYTRAGIAAARKKRFERLHETLENKWYVDEIYNSTLIQPLISFSKGLWKGFDVAVIDRIVLGFGRASEWTGQAVRVTQTGSIQLYAFMILLGLLATVGYLVYGLA